MMKQKRQLPLSSTLAILLASVAVGSVGNQTFASNANKQQGGSLITIDGSSTVFPITEAMAEEYQIANPGTRITVGISGTGGGFKKFCAGETDISNASRPIKTEEIELCKQNGIEYIELPVAYD
jgi:phosphate transport system substrate-binding protein